MGSNLFGEKVTSSPIFFGIIKKLGCFCFLIVLFSLGRLLRNFHFRKKALDIFIAAIPALVFPNISAHKERVGVVY
jgi:hypothetical protein